MHSGERQSARAGLSRVTAGLQGELEPAGEVQLESRGAAEGQGWWMGARSAGLEVVWNSTTRRGLVLLLELTRK